MDGAGLPDPVMIQGPVGKASLCFQLEMEVCQ
jgi:hypothetical protein